MDGNISLEKIIEQGQVLLKTLTKDPPVRGYIGPITYSFTNYDEYTLWRHTCLRYVLKNFPNDISGEELKNLFQEFEHLYRPRIFQHILGVLQSLREVPEMIVDNNKSDDNRTIQIINSNSQTQEQSINFDIIIQTIKDELTGRQLKELKEIVETEQDEEIKKKSVKEKIISFGHELAPNILANIITNPNIWGFMFS